jgi:formate dehydrogenase subunit gamma
MSGVLGGQHGHRAIAAARHRDNIAVDDVIVRHRLATRLIHWSVSVTFLIALFSGMPIWTPLFGWMAALVGGLHTARVIHPYAGVLFFIASIFQFFHWLPDMHFRSEEKGWFGPTLLRYMRWETEPSPAEGKYNGGQKMFFYAACLAALGLLLTGIPIWFPLQFPSLLLRETCILLHDIIFILLTVSVVGHIYLGTAAEPGTFRAMTRGTVTRAWARFHHPGWFRDVTEKENRNP